MTDQQTTDTDELYTTEGIIHIDDIYRNVIWYNEKGDLPEAIKLAKLHLSKQQKSVAYIVTFQKGNIEILRNDRKKN